MEHKTIILCTVALTLGGCYSNTGMSNNSGARYTPREEIYLNEYNQEDRMQDRMDTKSYVQYEHRESCQNYRKTPRNYSDNCNSNMMMEEIVNAEAPIAPKAILPIIRSYTILFDFDKSDIRGNEKATLDQIAQEINQYHPKQVTVTGYTDSHGKMKYNQQLSHVREQAVSMALLDRGIQNKTLNREARGEYQQAVKTADGVKNQQNRRVVIDFRR